MKAYKLVAIATAAVLTLASLGAIDYNVALQPAAASDVLTLQVTEFAPIHVYPSADELRGLSTSAADVDQDATIASTSCADTDAGNASFNLVGSALSMSHYAFGRKSGHIGGE